MTSGGWLAQAGAIQNPAIDYHAIAPELILAGVAAVVLIADLFLRSERKWIAMPLSLIGVAAALLVTLTLVGQERATFGGTYVIDSYAVLFKVFFLGTGMVVLL